MKDMKEALNSGVKPDITHMRTPTLNYNGRQCEYGNDKYERANYLRSVEGLRAAFERYRSYLRAGMSHIVKNLDAMEKHQASDPNLEDFEGMKLAAYAADMEESPKFPASGLPHVGGGIASLNMAVTQAVDAGLLPADPGQPWKDKVYHSKTVGWISLAEQHRMLSQPRVTSVDVDAFMDENADLMFLLGDE